MLAALVNSFWCGSSGHIWSHCFPHHFFIVFFCLFFWVCVCLTAIFCVQDHIFKLMKSDSYSRYLRSDQYKEYLSGTRKKVRHLPGIYSDWAIFKHWLAFTRALVNFLTAPPPRLFSLSLCPPPPPPCAERTKHTLTENDAIRERFEISSFGIKLQNYFLICRQFRGKTDLMSRNRASCDLSCGIEWWNNVKKIDGESFIIEY